MTDHQTDEREAPDLIEEALQLALEAATEALADASRLYAGYPPDGLGRNIVRAEKDLAMVRAALAARSRRELTEPWGWAIVDKDGLEVQSRARLTSVQGSPYEAPPYSRAQVDSLDRCDAERAPHRMVSLIAADRALASPAAEVAPKGYEQNVLWWAESCDKTGVPSTVGAMLREYARLLAAAPTAPEAGKGLTEERINQLASASEVYQYHPGAIVEFAREIERAHGIGGEEKA